MSDDKRNGGLGLGPLFAGLFSLETQTPGPVQEDAEVHTHFSDDGAPCECERCKRGISPGPNDIHVNFAKPSDADRESYSKWCEGEKERGALMAEREAERERMERIVYLKERQLNGKEPRCVN